MKRNSLKLICGAVAAMVFGTGAQLALAQTTMRIGIATAQHSHHGVAIDAFAKEVEAGTSGRVKVKTFYGSALGAERELIEAVQIGTQELALVSTGALPNFVPDVKVLDIPFLFRDYAHARAVLDGPIGQEMLQKFDAKGFKALAWGENGFRHMSNSKRPINSPDDLKGLKLRTMENPVHMQAYKAFGVNPTPMAFSEVFTALQQGTVDGQENPMSVFMASKFEQVQKHLSLTGHVYSPAVFIMNKQMFEKLSDADKKVFLNAAKAGVVTNRARVDADDREAVAALRAKGMQIVENVDKSKFQAALTKTYVDFEKQFGKTTIDRIRDYR